METINPFNKKFWTTDNWASGETDVQKPSAHIRGGNWGSYWYDSYDGEKNLGELGPIKDYRPNYFALRLRAWQIYLESDLASTVLNRYCLWVIDKGLKLQANPSDTLLKSEGLNLDRDWETK